MANEKFNEIKEQTEKELKKGNFDIFVVSSLFYDLYEIDNKKFFEFLFSLFKEKKLLWEDEQKEKFFKIVFDLFEEQVFSNIEFLNFLSRFSGEYPEIIKNLNFENIEKEKAMQLDLKGKSFFHWLALWSDKNGWTTTDKEILKLKDSGGWSVAHYLADNGTLTVRDPEILELQSKSGITVKKLLKESGKK